MRKELFFPYKEEEISDINAGDEVYLNGCLYVGRDQVHKRLVTLLESGEKEPFPFPGSAIYYMGPSPAPKGFALGAAGPTTSSRMDPFTPFLIERGLKVSIGKGPREESVRAAIEKYHGLYLQAYGGCGALYCSKIKKAETILWQDLGPEALLKIIVYDFPVFCMIDSKGRVYK